MKIKRILSIVLATALAVTCLAAVSFADDITYDQITGTGEATSGSTTISIEVSPGYYVKIPQTVSASTKTDISYDVKVWGDVSDEDSVSVTPDATIDFTKTGGGADNITINITQATTSWLGSIIPDTEALTPTVSGTIGIAAQADAFTAGEWTSTLNFAIAFTNNDLLHM